MSVGKAKSEGFNPLAQMGDALSNAGKAMQKLLSDATKGLPANAATSPVTKNGVGKTGKTQAGGSNRSGDADGKKKAGVKPEARPGAKPGAGGANSGPQWPKAGRLIGADGTGKTKVEVIHRFEHDGIGQSLKADDGFRGTGVGRTRDRTYQVVQNERIGKEGKKTWEVHVQPTGEGRVDANIHVFSSDRKLKPSDFNKFAKLAENYNKGVKALNADSNRLPEAPRAAAPKAAAPKQPDRWWIDQQARNVVGGTSALGTSIAGAVGSLPEIAIKLGSSLGNTGKATAHVLTGGQMFKTAFNPISTDNHYKYYNAPALAQEGMRAAQQGIDKSLGADANSLTYKTAEVVVPLVLMRGKGKGASQKVLTPGSQPPVALNTKALQPGSAAKPAARAAPNGPIKVSRSVAPPIKPVSKAFRQQYKNITAEPTPNGGIKMMQNGRPMRIDDVTAAVKSGQLDKAKLLGAGFSDKVADLIVKQAGQGGGAALGGGALSKTQPPPSTGGGGQAANAPKQLGGSKPHSGPGGRGESVDSTPSRSGSNSPPRAQTQTQTQSQPAGKRSADNAGTTYAEPPVNQPINGLNTGPLANTPAPIVRVPLGGTPVKQHGVPVATATPTPASTVSKDSVDAAKRMGAAFNAKGYNAGPSTPRMSQDPPRTGGSGQIPQRAPVREPIRNPGLGFAKPPAWQPLNTIPAQSMVSGDSFRTLSDVHQHAAPNGASAAATPPEGLPLPEGVRTVADALGVPHDIAKDVRNGYGGPFSGQAMAAKLLPDLSEAHATSLVQAVRSEQNKSTRVIKDQIKQALARTDDTGAPAPHFTQESWDTITHALNAQPALDSDATRALFRAAENPALHVDRGHNLIAMKDLKNVLVARGYDPKIVNQLPSSSLPLHHPFSNYTKTDVTFAQLVARSGMDQPIAELGLIDMFPRFVHPTAKNNTRFLDDGGIRRTLYQQNVDKTIESHGQAVSSVAGSGLGQFGGIAMAHVESNEDVLDKIEAMASEGIKTVNLSVLPDNYFYGLEMLSDIRDNSDVKFVVAAGNGRADMTKAEPTFNYAQQLNLPNLTFVGNVNLNGQISDSSNFHESLLYDYGTDRPVATVVWKDGNFQSASEAWSGNSFSAPQVAKTYHQMDYLHRDLSPAMAKAILTATARDVPQTAAKHQGLSQVLVVQHRDALKVAALGGLFARQQRPTIHTVTLSPTAGGGQSMSRKTWSKAPAGKPVTLEQCADILRLTPDEKARLLPIAKRLFETKQPSTGRR